MCTYFKGLKVISHASNSPPTPHIAERSAESVNSEKNISFTVEVFTEPVATPGRVLFWAGFSFSDRCCKYGNCLIGTVFESGIMSIFTQAVSFDCDPCFYRGLVIRRMLLIKFAPQCFPIFNG